MRSFVVQGHRGARGWWPENTIAGFLGAARMGVDSVELDACLTADGAVALSHDPRLDPDLTRIGEAWLVGEGPALASLTVADLAAYDVGRARPGSATARAFPYQAAADGARVPLLADVLAALAACSVRVDVELKTVPASDDAAVAALLDAVLTAAAGATARLALRSFDWRGLRLAASRTALPLTWLTDAETAADPAAWWGGGPLRPTDTAAEAVARAAGPALGRSTWAPEHRGLTGAAVTRAQALGLRVVPWTVNEPADLGRLSAWGVDGVCTDYPDRALALRRAFARG